MHPSDAPDHSDSADGGQTDAVDPIAAMEMPEGTDGDASAADVFEHLARIRAGISDGVITPW